MIVAAGFGLDRERMFPGIYALIPVIGAALLIVSPNSIVNRRVLSHPAMVFLGLISYPLYLWHWPLLSFLATLRNGAPNTLEIWAIVLTAVLLSWATYQLVRTTAAPTEKHNSKARLRIDRHRRRWVRHGYFVRL